MLKSSFEWRVWRKVENKSIENLVTSSFLVLVPSVLRASFKLLVKKLKMVAIKFIVLFIAVSSESMASLLPQAILQLVQSNYGEHPVLIEVFYNSREVKVLDETLKMLSRVKQLKVTPVNITKIILMGPPNFFDFCLLHHNICHQKYLNNAIFLFDTLNNYQIWKNKFIYKQMYEGRLTNHLVYCEDLSQEKIESFPRNNTYESFLLEQNNQVFLHAMTMFTEKQCRPEQLVEINRFSSLKSKWKTDKFFRPRIENFHGCTLVFDFRVEETEMPFLRVTQTGNKTSVEGAIIDMLDAFSTHLNFTYVYGKAAGKKLGLPENFFDLQVGPNMLEGIVNPSSSPIYSTADVMVVPPGELFTSWDKLFMPFDRPTWMWLGIVFAAAFLVILLIKLSKSASMYDLIIGSNVSTPTLNVIAIFMGIGQILLPQRNVSRFMFMVFILFSLIMRTAYQGKYFEFLTSDMRRRTIQTIEELMHKNFTAVAQFRRCMFIYCDSDLLAGWEKTKVWTFSNNSFLNYFRFNKEYLTDLLPDDVPNVNESLSYAMRSSLTIFMQLQDPTFKSFAIDNELNFSMYNYKKEPKDRLYFHQLERKIISYNVYVGFSPEREFLFSTFDWNIKQLVEGGFFALWIDRYLSHPSVQAPKPGDTKVVLTMDHLMVGFTIWLGMLLIAFVAFTVEFLRVHLANYFQGILFQIILRKHQRLHRNH